MIFIPNNVPSLKNSKQMVIRGSKPVLLPSKTVQMYLKKMGIKKYSAKGSVTAYKTRKNLFREAVGDYFDDATSPLVLGFHFVRDSKRAFDFGNAAQIIQDLLVAHGCIKDDNMKKLIPMPMMINGQWYSINKENPGVWLKIIEGPIEPLMFSRYD